MASLARFVRLSMQPLHELETWKSVLVLVVTVGVGVAAFLGFGALGSAVIVLLVITVLAVAAGVRLQTALDKKSHLHVEFEQLAASKQ